jgi:NAD(P)-dependent dehydrogenase (short-subunit alcohol dehydrogenase family)
MARVFITGSADGLGRAAAQTLLDDGHEVVIHARNSDRLTAADRDAGGEASLRDDVPLERLGVDRSGRAAPGSAPAAAHPPPPDQSAGRRRAG